MSAPLDPRVLPLVLTLGLDTFALSTALGVAPLPARARLRLALTFAAAEGLMPAAGLLLGRPLGDAIGAWAVYLAAVLLIATGAWLLREGLEEAGEHDGERSRLARAATARGLALAGLALSVSLDELAMGFSFGVLRVAVVPALVAIALQALVVSLAGQWLGQRALGRRAGARLGERAEALAGVLLCLLGVGFIAARVAGVAI